MPLLVQAKTTCTVDKEDIDSLYSWVYSNNGVSNLMVNTSYEYGYWIGSGKKKFTKDSYIINDYDPPKKSYNQLKDHYLNTQGKLETTSRKLRKSCLNSIGITVNNNAE